MLSKKAAAFPRLNGLNGPGRPSKRTKKVVAELIDAIGAGAPFGLACQAAGIHHDTFCDWRRRDPAFAIQVDQAAARGALKRLRKIEEHGEENFSALAWMLERRYPEMFSKPEVQLNVGVRTNLNGGSNNGQSFELVVISDLEYAGLRQCTGYTHHEEAVGDIETQTVPTEGSGYLTRDGAENSGQIISQSQATHLNESAEAVRSRISKLFQKYRPQQQQISNNNGQSPSVPAPSPLVKESAVITHREGDEKNTIFWQLLVRSDGDTIIARESAIFVCRTILAETLGLRVANVRIDFKAEPIKLCELLGALEKLTGGPAGWRRVLKKAEMDG